jgi:hypothetical protein
MKTKTNWIVIFSLLFALAFSACAPAPAAAAEAPAAAPAESEPLAEPTAVPTQAWQPIPCSVVFDTDRDGNWEVYIMGPDGENPLNLSNDPADDTNPAISPDGKRIAFVSNRESNQGGGQNIYVVNADGSNLRQLTFQGSSDGPSWSHDGAMIVYSNNGDIYFTDANDGSAPQQVTFTPEEDKEPKWSPDGSKLAWLSGKDGHYDVLVSSPDFNDLHSVTDTSSIYSVYWTADGRLLIDSWGWKDKEEFCHNCVVTQDGKDIEDAGGKGEVRRFRPFWNGQGDRVELVNLSLDGGPDEIYLVGEVFPDLFYNLTNNSAWDRNPDWPAKCGPEYVPTAEDLQPAQEPQEQPAQEQQEQSAQVAQSAQPKEAKDIVIGYEGEPNDRKLADLKQACAELGIQCVQGKDFDELTGKGVDAIISFSNIWKVMGDWPKINAAALQGFPLYILDGETTEINAFNLSVESTWLHTSLQWTFDQMGDSGKMAYLDLGPDYFKEIVTKNLSEHPNIQATLIPASYDDMSALSEGNIAALVAKEPDLGAIWTSDPQPNIFWGLNDMQGDQYPAIACLSREGELQAWKERRDAHPAFQCIAVVKPGGNAYEAVYVAYYRLTGLELDPAALGGEFGNTLLYGDTVITNENLDEWLDKIGDLRANDWGGLELPPMTPEEIKEQWFLE